MIERKSLSKKTRFEVFKRDNFTCQYCGATAPDAILEVDHIKPVKEGGDNELMNLVTSCFACNRGKGARVLSDTSLVEKQRVQIEELNIRRQQLEMMLEWRDGVRDIDNIESDKAIEYWNDKIDPYNIELGLEDCVFVKKLVTKYGVIKVLDAMDVSERTYLKGRYEDVDNATKKIGGILHLQSKPQHVKDIAYIKGICRNKFDYFNERNGSILLSRYHKAGGSLSNLKELVIADRFKNWTEFRGSIECYISESMNDGCLKDFSDFLEYVPYMDIVKDLNKPTMQCT